MYFLGFQWENTKTYYKEQFVYTRTNVCVAN